MQTTVSSTYVLKSNQKSSSPILCLQSCISNQAHIILKKFLKQSFSVFPCRVICYLLKTTCSQKQRPGMCLLPQQSPCSAILVALPSFYHPTYQAIKSYLRSVSFLTSSNIPTSTQFHWKKNLAKMILSEQKRSGPFCLFG